MSTEIKFHTHNSTKGINTNFTSLQGEIQTTYAQLEEMFGEPTDGDGYKIDAEWEIQFEDGTVVTIYNYKDGVNYNGASGLHKTQITNWHIGGHSSKATDKLAELLAIK